MWPWRKPADFRNEPLGDMVASGGVGPREIRIWARSQRAGQLTVRWWPEGRERDGGQGELTAPVHDVRDGTCSLAIPGDVPGAAPLEPGTRYRYRVVRQADERLVGEGAFWTAPASEADAPERFSIGLFSCHQPFRKDGRIAHHVEPMLRAAAGVLDSHDTRLLLAMGDQCYTDYPPRMSLMDRDYFARVAPPGREAIQDCSVAEVRRLLQRRYRHFWSVPGWRDLHARFACHPILDDHEIVDNWGSAPEHQEPRWQSVGSGARWAYLDYQASRVRAYEERLPADFDASIAYGPIAIHVLDLRSSRRVDGNGRLLSPTQLERLAEFLRREADRPILALVLSVPIVHMPRPLAKLLSRITASGEDFSDRWTSLNHVEDRDRVLRMLHDHQRRNPDQRVLLLSGDIHIGCAHEVRWRDGTAAFHQLISSGITNRAGPLLSTLSAWSIRTNKAIETMDEDLTADVHLLRDRRSPRKERRNPYRDLNLGLLQLERRPTGRGWGVTLVLFGRHGRCVFRNPLD